MASLPVLALANDYKSNQRLVEIWYAKRHRQDKHTGDR
jgi:hypothetical protein